MNEEVTERDLSTLTPEIIKPKGAARRYSAGKVATRASLTLSNDGGRHRPHVLRASTGSCHDFCKYGIKHGFEGKEKHLFLRKSSGIYATEDNEKNVVKGLNLGERRERSVIKLTVSPKLLPLKREKSAASSAKTNESTEEHEILKQKTPSLVKKIELSEELEIIKRTASHVKEIEPSEELEIIKQNTSLVSTNDLSDKYEAKEERIPSPIKTNELSEESEIKEQTISSPVKTNESCEELETIKQSTPPAQKNGLSEDSDTIEQTIPVEKTASSEEPTIMQTTPSLKKIELSKERENIKQKMLTVKKIMASTKPKIKQKVPSPIKKTNSSAKKIVSKQTVSSPAKRFDASAKHIVSKQIASSPAKRFDAPAKHIVSTQTASSPAKRFDAHAKHIVITQTASSPAKRFVASSKPAISGKPRTPAVKSTSPLTTSRALTGRIKSENKIVKSAGLSTVGEKKKVLKSPAASLSPKAPVNRLSNLKPRNMNTKSVSFVKNQNKSGKAELSNNKIEEKTLYVVEPKQEIVNLESVQPNNSNYQSSPSLPKQEIVNLESVQPKTSNYQSSTSLPSSSSSKLSLSSSPSVSYHEEEEEHGESESTFSEGSDLVYEGESTESNQIEFAVGEDKKRLRRVAMIHPEDKDPTPYKLKFRRGKVVSLQSENNGPRRLRFRQRRVVGENQNAKGEVGRRSFRRRRELVSGDPNNPNPEAPTVVLRHQDMQGKKDTQSLFNHVIEETASKLVETRKSKVKALVGAFETVISLQESKPAATV